MDGERSPVTCEAFSETVAFLYRRFDQAQRSGARGEISCYKDKTPFHFFLRSFAIAAKEPKRLVRLEASSAAWPWRKMYASGFDSAYGGIAVPLHFPFRLQGGRNSY